MFSIVHTICSGVRVSFLLVLGSVGGRWKTLSSVSLSLYLPLTLSHSSYSLNSPPATSLLAARYVGVVAITFLPHGARQRRQTVGAAVAVGTRDRKKKRAHARFPATFVFIYCRRYCAGEKTAYIILRAIFFIFSKLEPNNISTYFVLHMRRNLRWFRRRNRSKSLFTFSNRWRRAFVVRRKRSAVYYRVLFFYNRKLILFFVYLIIVA